MQNSLPQDENKEKKEGGGAVGAKGGRLCYINFIIEMIRRTDNRVLMSMGTVDKGDANSNHNSFK